MTRSDPDELVAPFAQAPDGAWPGARWMGWIDDRDERLQRSERLALRGGDGFGHARLLVRRGRQPRGFVELDVHDGRVATADIRAALDGLPLPAPVQDVATDDLPAITVALCTRDRGDQLRVALDSLLALDYPRLSILVVDNASRTDAATRLVRSVDDPRVRVVYEPRPGLSCARNRALIESDTSWIAFTDDDVVVDDGWLRGVAAGIARDSRVGVVCGMVATGELASPNQLYFENRIAWVGDLGSTVFDPDDPPADTPLFPFEVGVYGTGANFAVDRALAVALGGFDEALGAGTPTGGGEDIDMFVRVVVSGRTLVREPSATVWHRHRASDAELRTQLGSYGIGMSAWMTSVLLHADTRGLALRRVPGVLRRLPAVGRVASGPDPASAQSAAGPGPSGPSMRGVEVRGLLRGPAVYVRSCLGGRPTRPLRHARP